MYKIKKILAAASLAVLTAAGASSVNAAPTNNHQDHRDYRQAARHPIVVRERVFNSLRLHHYRGLGAPVFVHGHYVVRSINRLGRIVFVEVDPYTGAFLGEFRI